MIKFVLEHYRSGGSNRYTCPGCGQKKCFTRYVDVNTGEQLADECGKCNHEASCGYHYPPRDYFRDHPDRDYSSQWERPLVNGKYSVLGNRGNSAAPVHKEVIQTEFFDNSWVEKASLRPSTFRTWMEQLPFEHDRIQEVLKEYYVGATNYDIVFNGVNYGPSAVFWMIDEQQQVHDAKFIAYTADGHRVNGWGDSMRSRCKKMNKGPQLEETEKVLFGLHLLPRYPDKVVCIVESEKSALICACRYPEYIWLATGGCGNLQASKLRPLANRHVVIYPDSGCYDKWKSKLAESPLKSYTISNVMEDYLPNTDIADVLLGEARLPDDEATQAFKRMKADNPAISELAQRLDLVAVSIGK
ncbi:MAG: DUF6371 domain-containing protein [Prevotellaceae bacterium]|nr:DUF6371 domain-containing protein [Prevotellaceae bacterium]